MMLRLLALSAVFALAAAGSTGSVRPGGVGFSLAATGNFFKRLVPSALQFRPRQGALGYYVEGECAKRAEGRRQSDASVDNDRAGGLRAAKAKAAASGVAKREGADAHWDNFIGGKWGDFHGRFCRWDPTSCNLLVETHLLRSYHVHEENSERFLRQQNKIFFDDGREPVSRGPWDVTKACSTECGIVHPRVGKGESGTTFLITPGSAQATAWAVHKITKNDPLLNPGVVPLGEGKGHEGQGYMVEMIVSHGEHVRLSIGYVSAQLPSCPAVVAFSLEQSPCEGGRLRAACLRSTGCMQPAFRCHPQTTKPPPMSASHSHVCVCARVRVHVCVHLCLVCVHLYLAPARDFWFPLRCNRYMMTKRAHCSM